jgi:putative MATE family efflux protein
MGSSFIFSLGAIFMPEYILSIYTNDPEVIKLGSQFLHIIGWSYVITSITFSYATVLRSVEQVKLPMLVSLIALGTNTCLNYLLIFGHAGFPALGVQGSAIANCIARYLECFLMLMLVYRSQSILAAPIANLFTIPWRFLPQFFKTTLPVVLTEVLWSVGITVYNIIYAHISTEAITATNIAGTIERVAFVLFLGVGSAGAVMIGNLIGANKIDLAKKYAHYFITIAPTTAIIIGLFIFVSRRNILTLYDISPLATDYTLAILAIISFALPLKATNFTMLVAVIRSGGDTRFALMLESMTIWVIGVPLAFLGAFVWHLPVYWVYLLVMTEELVKCIVGLYRVHSGKWVNNLVHET